MPVPQVTIEEYLQVLPNYTFADKYIYAAMASQGIEEGSLAYPIPEPEGWEKQRDLAEAKMWDTASGLVNGGGSSKKLGNRSYTESSIQTSEENRAAWQAKADALRLKWGISPDDEVREIFDQTDMW